MMKKITPTALSAYSLTAGAGLNDAFILLAVTSDRRLKDDPEDDHSYLVSAGQGQYQIDDVPFSVRSQASVSKPEPGIVSLNYLGGVAFDKVSGEGFLEDKVGEASGKKVFGRTVLNQVRSIDGFAYAVGTHRAVYCRREKQRWSVMDRGTFDDDDFDCGFDSIHGFSAKDIYAAGEGGEIWQYDGSKWRQRETGTNVYLHSVLCASDGVVYAAGACGTILTGRADQWTRLKSIPRRLEFWSIEEFRGRIFAAASTSLLFELKDGKLELVDFGECPIPTSVHHLFTTETSLYALGSKHLRRFDGSEWHELLTLD